MSRLLCIGCIVSLIGLGCSGSSGSKALPVATPAGASTPSATSASGSPSTSTSHTTSTTSGASSTTGATGTSSTATASAGGGSGASTGSGVASATVTTGGTITVTGTVSGTSGSTTSTAGSTTTTSRASTSSTTSTQRQADLFVDGNTGSDTNTGRSGSPVKTLTHALTLATTGQKIEVAAGTYDASTGEQFPLVLPAGLTLLGKASSSGALPHISGYGAHGPLFSMQAFATIVAGDGGTLEGFRVSTTQLGPLYFGLIIDAAAFSVRNCVFQNSYGGVFVTGTKDCTIENNLFETSSYGVYSWCNGVATIDANTFTTPALPIDNVFGNALITDNTIEGNGQVGIQIQHGSPELRDNMVIGSTNGYQYGAVYLAFDATPILRDNVFKVTRNACIRIEDRSNPDLGTTTDPGGNEFYYDPTQGSMAIELNGESHVQAIGNQFDSQTPSCGIDMQVSAGTTSSTVGSVTWGTGSGEHCP